MGKLLHDRLTIFAQRNNFYSVNDFLSCRQTALTDCLWPALNSDTVSAEIRHRQSGGTGLNASDLVSYQHLMLDDIFDHVVMGSWLIPYTTHYNQVFIDITKDLLAMLGHSRDYHRVIEYASRALSLEPGIQDAYYWISIAAEATGNSMMKDRYDQMAREELPEEEYQKVQHLLEIRTHKEE